MVLKSVGVLSAGKICGILGVFVGLLGGAMMALVTVLGAVVGMQQGGNQEAAIPAALMGVGSLILLPIFYGVLCFISGVIYALIYNVAASVIGGLEMEFEHMPPQA